MGHLKIVLIHAVACAAGWAELTRSEASALHMPFVSIMLRLACCSALVWVSCCWVLTKPPRSERSLFNLILFSIIFFFCKLILPSCSLTFLPIAFQDSACFLPKEAISLHAPNQNVSSAVTDGWIWVSCGNLMNNIYHLIS